jgi:methoxymalonate biosynthesis acyl carrier protein
MNISELRHPRPELVAEIQAFISAHVRNVEIGPSDDIFERGLVNSMFALQLVNFIESRFHLEIADDDLVLENFNSAVALAKFVERLQSRRI